MDQGAEAVSLNYTMTADDIRHGLRTRARAASGWPARATLPIGIGLLAAALALTVVIAVTDGLDAQTWTWIIVYVLVLLTVLVLLPVIRKRQYQRIADRMGTIRCEVDDESVRLVSQYGATTNNWTAYGSFVETEQAFVLLSPDKKRIVFTVLPKRGLSERSDPERLRGILARHLS